MTQAVVSFLPESEAPENLDHTIPLESALPGMVVFADQQRLLIKTGDGLLEILQIRPEGKRDMPVKDFLHGHAVRPGDRMGVQSLIEQ